MVEVTNGGEEVPQCWRGGEAGWTADSGGGERPEALHQVGAAAGGEVGVGGGEGVVIQPPTPTPFRTPLENAETGVSGLSTPESPGCRSLRGLGRRFRSDRSLRC